MLFMLSLDPVTWEESQVQWHIKNQRTMNKHKNYTSKNTNNTEQTHELHQ